MTAFHSRMTSIIWQLKFNADKCKVMHVGHNSNTRYFMGEGAGRKELELVTEEKDLGVLTTSTLGASSQCIKSAATAKRIIAMVRRNFRKLDIEDFNIIYRLYIRPHLEHCIQAWSPHLVKDVETLERIQRTATRLVPKLKKMDYSSRLKLLGIPSLKDRRIRGDMIEVYKLMSGKEKVDHRQFFQISCSQYNLRGHNLKLLKKRSRLEVRKHFFSQRTVSVWNSLPKQVVNAESVNGFKNAYDHYNMGNRS